jgi:hypothetical protein
VIDKGALLDKVNFEDFYSQFLIFPGGHRNVNCRCPFHDDTAPSLSLDLQTGLFKCHGCDRGGDVFAFVMHQYNVDFPSACQIIADYANTEVIDIPEARSFNPRGQKLPPINPPALDPQIAADYHAALPKAKRDYLTNKRGLSDIVINTFELGWDGDRITIPVFTHEGKLMNIRRYMPKSEKNKIKFLSYKEGYGQARLFPSDEIEGDEVWLLAGEWDTLLGRQLGFNSYCGTGGEEVFLDSWVPKFAGKKVYICYDIDTVGIQGAEMASAKLCKVAETRVVPLPITSPPNGDFTDYFLKHGGTKDELRRIADQSPVLVGSPSNSAAPPELAELIPEPSFISNYMEYAIKQTDAPPIFHLAVALSILSTCLGNRVAIYSFGHYIYPNLWVLILAPSGIFRKSTSMDIGTRLLKQIAPDMMCPHDFTREKLITHLSQHPAGLVTCGEFGELLAKMNIDYMKGLKEVLTHLYDCPPEYRRETMDKEHGTITITKPAVGLLGATTIDWLYDRVKDGDIRGGFLARFAVISADEKLDTKGMTMPPDPMFEESLLDFLSNMTMVEGIVEMPVATQKVYRDWILQHEGEIVSKRLDPALQGFYTRLGTYALKFSVLYELAMTQSLRVSPEAMRYAIKFAEHVKHNITKRIGEVAGGNATAQNRRKVESVVERHLGATKAKILRELPSFTTRELQTILDTLVDAHIIRPSKDTESGEVSYFKEALDD